MHYGRRFKVSLNILGPKLEEISVKFVMNWSEKEEMPLEWHVNRNLRSASFFGELRISDIRGVLQSPKPLLASLDLKLRPENNDAKEIIALDAAGTVHGAFRKLIARNKGSKILWDIVR